MTIATVACLPMTASAPCAAQQSAAMIHAIDLPTARDPRALVAAVRAALVAGSAPCPTCDAAAVRDEDHALSA